MIGAVDSFNQKEFSGREARLWQEWKDLDTLCNKRKAASSNPRKPSLSYVIRRRSFNGLPIEFEIWYRVKSIVGVKDYAGTARADIWLFAQNEYRATK